MSKELLPKRPWSVAPLDGKYYGTRVLDADGNELFRLWFGSSDTPSRREDPDADEASHMETAEELFTAELIVNLVNMAHIEPITVKFRSLSDS